MRAYFRALLTLLDRYEHMEKVEYGDLNYIIKDRCFAFAGPQSSREAGLLDGYSTLTPEDYYSFFKKKNVTTIIRLNKKCDGDWESGQCCSL